MIVRSEFSFRKVFGPMKEVVARLPSWGGAIADDGTWGHVPFVKECAKQDRKPILGRRVPLGGQGWAVVLPRSSRGLKALYGLPVGPLDWTRAADEDWWVLAPGEGRPGRGPNTLTAFVPGVTRLPAAASGALDVAFSDNLYPTPGDRQAWELMLGREASSRPGPKHILSGDELLLEGATPAQLDRLREVIEGCTTELPKAENIRFPVADAQAELVAISTAELNRRGLGDEYRKRLDYELGLIAQKSFADYFLVIADLMRYAKQHMLLGPARGSSCGSVVCWLTRITEVDPLQHGLLFERFIDLNRFDLPDIDIDFQDDRRHLVITYLAEKYGQHNVAQIGTVMRYKPKSALTDIAKSAGVPLWELDKLKDVVIERSSGDSRFTNQLSDSLDNLEVGKALALKYPILRVAARIEGHARSAGTHAAGIIVCNAPVTEYCSVTDGGAQIDKKMAESLNMLKIDALGLRTLSVIAECCELVKKPLDEMYALELDDQAVFDMLNEHKYSSVFQFEGPALRSVARQVHIDCFQDIAAITALCRPGPLSGGETQRWVLAKATGKWAPMHPALDAYTSETFGTIIYQEQVMRVTRELGGFSWADTAKIRKLMSDRKGDEEFGKFGDQFIQGAIANGVKEEDAHRIWKAINAMGSWSFNKSHAVAYGILSYWTAWLKRYHAVEFAVANLRHAKDDDAAKSTLRELMREGAIDFIPVDRHRSTDRWEFNAGALLGPLTGLPGCGAKTAREILSRRASGVPLSPRHQKLLAGESKFADYAPTRARWGSIYDDPLGAVSSLTGKNYFQRISQVDEIVTLTEHEGGGNFCVLGRLVKKNLRDLNDEKYVAKRGGVKVAEDATAVLFMTLEDDTGQLLCRIGPDKFERIGKRIVEEAALDTWFAVSGKLPDWTFKLMLVENVKWLSEA